MNLLPISRPNLNPVMPAYSSPSASFLQSRMQPVNFGFNGGNAPQVATSSVGVGPGIGMGSGFSTNPGQVNDMNWYNSQNNLLTGERNDFGNSMTNLLNTGTAASQNNLNNTLAKLTGSRNDFATQIKNLIGGQTNDLANSRNNYQQQTNNLIGAEQGQNASDLLSYTNAQNLARDNAINQGTRANKAMFAMNGTGPSSYADRLAVSLRMGANANAANNIAQRQFQNTQNIQGQQQNLNTNLNTMGRSDLQSIFGNNLAAQNELQGQQRSDLGFGYGAQQGIDQNNLSQLLGLTSNQNSQMRSDNASLLPLRERLAQQGILI